MTVSDDQKLHQFAKEAARLLSDLKCEEVALLDVRDLSQVCNYVLIASGTSDRQMKSVVNELEDLGDEFDSPCFRSNKDTGVTWIVIDFIDLVTHLFEPGQRDYYDLEGLWSDAPRIEWKRTDNGST